MAKKSNKDLDQLKSKVSEFQKSMEELQRESISDKEREKKIEKLKKDVVKTQQEVEKKIEQLGNSEDTKINAERKKAEALLTSLNEITNLQTAASEQGEEIEQQEGEESEQQEEGKKAEQQEEGKKAEQQKEGEEVEQQKEGANPSETESTNIFSKAWGWTKEQRSDVWNKEKWSSDTGKNILRTVGFAATGVGAVALAYKGLKKLFGRRKDKKSEDDEEDEKKEEKKSSKKKKPFWDRWYGKVLKWTGIGTGIYYIAHGLKTHKWNIKDFLDWKAKGENPLTIEEATLLAAGDVNNGNIDENMYRQNFDNGIEYDKEHQTILSYGESTEINEKGKCIVGLESVKFKTNVELVHAANIVNCLKYNLRGCGSAKSAFAETSTGGDISFSFSVDGANEVLSGSNSDFWQNTLAIAGVVLGITAGAATKSGAVGIGATLGLGAAGYLGGQALDDNSSLGKCCSTIKDGDNFNKFIAYLNGIEEGGQSIWLPGKQKIESENKSPIQEYINNVVEELDNTNITEVPEGKIRNLRAEQDPHNPNRYKISSYGQSTYITISGNITMLSSGQIDPTSIKSITVEKYSENDIGGELKLDFPHTKEGLKECLRVVNLSNMFRKKYGGYGGEKYPFFYNLMPYVQGNSMPVPIIPFVPPINSAYDSGFWVDTNGEGNLSNKGERVIKNESLEKYCPTLLKDLIKNKENSQSYFEDQLNNKTDGSSFIKFLNGMRTTASQNYWTNGQNNS